MDRSIFKYLIPAYILWFVIHIIAFFSFTLGMALSPRISMFGWMIPIMISHVLVILCGIAFFIWMLVDCAMRKFKEDSERVIWILVIIFLNVLGAIIYFYIHGKKPLKKESKAK